MNRTYLQDLVETTHEFLKMLEEHTSKSKHVFVQRRRAARKSTTKSKKKKKETPGRISLSLSLQCGKKIDLIFSGNFRTTERATRRTMAERHLRTSILPFTRLRRNDDPEIRCLSIRCTFGSASGWSEVRLDCEFLLLRHSRLFSLTAVARIQHALRTNKLDEAIALFRASR